MMHFLKMLVVTHTPAKPKRKSLKKKVEVTQFHDKSPSTSIRDLGEKFECGKIQISYNIKHKAEILVLFETNACGSCHVT